MSFVPPAADGQAALAFVPRLRLFTETLVVNGGSPFDPEEREQRLPVLSLRFDYGGRLARPGQRRADHARDLEGERRAGQLLESFGPVEIACRDDLSTRLGSAADYVLGASDDGEQDRHACCSFTAYALPQLRALRLAGGDRPRLPVPGGRRRPAVLRRRRCRQWREHPRLVQPGAGHRGRGPPDQSAAGAAAAAAAGAGLGPAGHRCALPGRASSPCPSGSAAMSPSPRSGC